MNKKRLKTQALKHLCRKDLARLHFIITQDAWNESYGDAAPHFQGLDATGPTAYMFMRGYLAGYQAAELELKRQKRVKVSIQTRCQVSI